MIKATTTPSGAISTKVIRRRVNRRLQLKRWWMETLLYLRILRATLLRPFTDAVAVEARLFVKVLRSNGQIEDLGLVCTKVVTNDGVYFLTDAFQGTADPNLLRYHASGTGVTAPSPNDSALVTEVEARANGSTTEGASQNIYRTQATIAYTGPHAITEHGIFSQSGLGGTLLDRSTFNVINVESSDSIQFTYELTLPSGN